MRKHISFESNKAMYFIEVIKYIRKKAALISGKVCENVPYKFLHISFGLCIVCPLIYGYGLPFFSIFKLLFFE
jgi:hypothetical protein